MNLFFSVYDILDVALYDIPERIYPFLLREYEYFKAGLDKSNDLEIRFVDDIPIPYGYSEISDGFFYKEGVSLLLNNGAVIRMPLKDIVSGRVVILAEKNISEWLVLYAVEKILHLKAIEKGYCFFHAAGFTRNNKAILKSTLQMGGKTQWVIDQIRDGGKFLGDDLVLVDRQGYAYAYPRGLNVHIFHNTLYDKAMRIRYGNRYLIKSVKFRALQLIAAVLPRSYSLSRRLNNRIKARSLLRMHINELIPNIVAEKKTKLEKILINLDCKKNNCTIKQQQWDKNQSVDFLISNTNIERLGFISRFIEPFLSINDKVSRSLNEYIDKILSQEKKMVSQVLDGCDIELILNN